MTDSPASSDSEHRQPESHPQSHGLAGTQEHFRVAVESAPIAMVMVDEDGVVELANMEAHRIFAYPSGQMIGLKLEQLVPERISVSHVQMRQSFFERPEPRSMGVGRDLFGRRSDGSEFPVEIGLNPVRTQRGLFVLSAIADISERLRINEELEESRRELVDLAENSNVPMHWVGTDGIIQWANRAELELLGYSDAEFIGQPIARFHHCTTTAAEIHEKLNRREELSGYEAQLITADGSLKTVSINTSPYVKSDVLHHSRCFLTDITEKKQAQQRLSQRARDATLLHRITSLAAVAQSTEEAFEQAITAICDIAGWSIGHALVPRHGATTEMVCSGIWHLSDPQEFAEFQEVSRTAVFPSGVGLPGRVLKTGQPAWIADVAADTNFPRNQLLKDLPVHGAFAFPVLQNNKVTAVLEFFARESLAPDESVLLVVQSIGVQLAQAAERINTLQQLEDRAQDLERSNRELQEFAYVASHDLKSPLRAILHLAQWIIEDEENQLSEQSTNDLQSLMTRAEGMSRLLDDLLAYSRVGRKAYETLQLDLNKIVTEILETIDKPADFQIHIKGSLPSLLAPPVPIRLVMQNLIENAVKHHDHQTGCVTVSAEETPTEVILLIADDGPGISPADREKIFEIFVTLASSDEKKKDSSGMGLALVRKTVEVYGGKIRVDCPDSSRGTTFRVEWPKTPAVVAPSDR